MASDGTSAEKALTAPDENDDRKPDSPTELPKRSWKYTTSNWKRCGFRLYPALKT